MTEVRTLRALLKGHAYSKERGRKGRQEARITASPDWIRWHRPVYLDIGVASGGLAADRHKRIEAGRSVGLEEMDEIMDIRLHKASWMTGVATMAPALIHTGWAAQKRWDLRQLCKDLYDAETSRKEDRQLVGAAAQCMPRSSR
jgi:hypothetical protein